MNTEIKYLDQINAFNMWTEYNYVSGTAQLLWFKLMHIWNRCRWQETMNIDNHRLMSALGINSQKPLRKARDELVELGLIEFTSGHKRHPSTYKMIPFVRSEDGYFDRPKQCQKSHQNDIKEVVQEPDNVHIDVTKSHQKGTYEDFNEPVMSHIDVTKEHQTSHQSGDLGNRCDDTGPDKCPIGVTKEHQKSHHIKTKTKTKTKSIYKDLTNVKSSSTDKQSTTDSHQEKIDYTALVNFWNEHHGNMPTIKSINGTRRNSVRARINEYSKSDFKTAILKAEQSDFLNGRAKDFIANFDWIIKPKNFTKVLEGNYDNHDFSQKIKEITFKPTYSNKYQDQKAVGDYLMRIATGNTQGDRYDTTNSGAVINHDEDIVSGVFFDIDT